MSEENSATAFFVPIAVQEIRQNTTLLPSFRGDYHPVILSAPDWCQLRYIYIYQCFRLKMLKNDAFSLNKLILGAKEHQYWLSVCLSLTVYQQVKINHDKINALKQINVKGVCYVICSMVIKLILFFIIDAPVSEMSNDDMHLYWPFSNFTI